MLLSPRAPATARSPPRPPSPTTMNGLNLSGPGILWTASKIRKPDLLDWGTFLKWYEGDLIPRCMALSGFNTALRATSRDHSDERPNLVILTLDDLAFFDTDEFKTIPDYSEILPGSGKFWEVVDFENRWYSLLSVFDHKKEPLCKMLWPGSWE